LGSQLLAKVQVQLAHVTTPWHVRLHGHPELKGEQKIPINGDQLYMLAVHAGRFKNWAKDP
jgi:hypothetical protein